jgi:preprotein translocase subunit YajC
VDEVLNLQEAELKAMLAEIKQLVVTYGGDVDIVVKINDGKAGGKTINIIIDEVTEMDIALDRIYSD